MRREGRGGCVWEKTGYGVPVNLRVRQLKKTGNKGGGRPGKKNFALTEKRNREHGHKKLLRSLREMARKKPKGAAREEKEKKNDE